MATEETNSPEFQEKAGLKRKPTGPPRLILGKSRSPGQDEKKSDARKQRRQQNTDTPSDAELEEQDKNKAVSEMHEMKCESSQSGLEMGKEIHTDVQEEPVGTNLNSEHNMLKKHDDKRGQKRSRSKSTFQRIFLPALICVRKSKGLESTRLEIEGDTSHQQRRISCQDIRINNDELQIPSCDSLSVTKMCKADHKRKAERRNFSVRMWSIFKRCSVTSKLNHKQEKNSAEQFNDRFIEEVPEKSDQFERAVDVSECCAPETSGHETEDEQQNGPSVVYKDMATIHDEDSSGAALGCEDECTETHPKELSVDSNTRIIPEDSTQTPDVPCVTNQEEPVVEIIAISEPFYLSNSILPCIYESSSDAEETFGAPDCAAPDPDTNVPTKPVITIEDVHSSDEENQEPVENSAPRCTTVSGLLSLNECYKSKTKTDYTLKASEQNDHTNQLSEILLAQTAYNLVHSAISGALEQLAAEMQSQTKEDRV